MGELQANDARRKPVLVGAPSPQALSKPSRRDVRIAIPEMRCDAGREVGDVTVAQARPEYQRLEAAADRLDDGLLTGGQQQGTHICR